jgi:hypothetical protein
MSNKWRLNKEDWKKWGINFLIFVFIPTASAFLTAYQIGFDLKYAWGVAVGTFYTSCVDLYKKWKAGN